MPENVVEFSSPDGSGRFGKATMHLRVDILFVGWMQIASEYVTSLTEVDRKSVV